MKKAEVHEFFNNLVARFSLEEQVNILRDIMVDEFCFNGITEDLSELETEVHEGMKTDPSKKINWIKTVRDRTGLGLKEAKDFVESLQPGNPLYGQAHYRNVGKVLPLPNYNNGLAGRLEKIAKRYGKSE